MTEIKADQADAALKTTIQAAVTAARTVAVTNTTATVAAAQIPAATTTSRARFLTRAAELETDAEDDVDSITLELAISPSTPTPPPTMMGDADVVNELLNIAKPFKIKDITRHIRKAVVATTLAELRAKVVEKFQRSQPSIHLDCDGTEIDDEEYFGTLEANAELIAVFPGEHWRDSSEYNAHMQRRSLDAQRLRKLVGKLQQNCVNDADLEMLSNMDPNSLLDITGREQKDSDYCMQSEASARRSTELSC